MPSSSVMASSEPTDPRTDRGMAWLALARVGTTLRQAALPIVALVVLVLIWWFASAVLRISAIILPSPAAVFNELVNTLPTLMHYMQTTALETTLGFLLAVVLGVPLGVAIVFSPPIRATVYPLLVGSQMIPKVTLAPLFLVWFGLGILSKIMIAFLVAFFPIVIATALGMQLVDPDMVRLFRSMGSTPMRTFRKLRVPTALPSIFAGCKVAITLAVVGAIVGEFVGANSGLGYYIIFQNGQLKTPAVYAAIIVVTVMGIVMYAGIELLERLVSPHRGGSSDQFRSSM